VVLKVIPSVPIPSTTLLASNEVKIQMKACPVTSEDIRSINGLSFLRPHVGIAGTFGVGTILATGANVKSSTNSQVLVLSKNGTWTNQITANSSFVFDVSSLTCDQAALVPDVASAWSILNHSARMASGMTVIRTNQNSSVFNFAFDAIAKAKGCNVIVAKDADFVDTKFQQSIGSKGGAALILSPHAGKANRNYFRLLSQNGTLVTYNGLTIPSLQDATGIEGPTTKLIFNNHRIKGFNFPSLVENDPLSGREAIVAAVNFLKEQGSRLENQIKKFPEDQILSAISSTEAGESVIVTIN